MVEKSNTQHRLNAQSSIELGIELNLPTPIYSKMQIGVISSRSRLDDILDACHITYEEYILYVEAVKVSKSNLKSLLF